MLKHEKEICRDSSNSLLFRSKGSGSKENQKKDEGWWHQMTREQTTLEKHAKSLVLPTSVYSLYYSVLCCVSSDLSRFFFLSWEDSLQETRCRITHVYMDRLSEEKKDLTIYDGHTRRFWTKRKRETRQRREEKSSNETYNLSLQYAYDCNAKQAEKGNYTIHELCAWSHFSCKWLPSSRCVLCNGIKCSSHNHLINCLFSLSSLVWQERLVFLYIDVGGKNIQCFSLSVCLFLYPSMAVINKLRMALHWQEEEGRETCKVSTPGKSHERQKQKCIEMTKYREYGSGIRDQAVSTSIIFLLSEKFILPLFFAFIITVLGECSELCVFLPLHFSCLSLLYLFSCRSCSFLFSCCRRWSWSFTLLVRKMTGRARNWTRFPSHARDPYKNSCNFTLSCLSFLLILL